MYLFKGHGGALSSSESAPSSPPCAAEAVAQKSETFFDRLMGEERPKDMLALLAILVLLLHVWGFMELLQPAEQTTEAKPLVMEVSMIAIPAAKPSVAPPRPVPPPPEKKPPPPKPQPKPIPKKAPPVVQQKAPDFAPTEPVAEPQPQQPVQQTAPSQSPAVSESKATATPTETQQFTEANFRANYAHNPKPEYPSIAKSRGWQGKVMLRVQVSAEGLSDAVAVETSSGHEILDEAAIEAVKKWKFIPAKRGETPVASSVIVPIIFTLRE
ncbi:MAG: energy transducer TonB [Methylomonas sp.]